MRRQYQIYLGILALLVLSFWFVPKESPLPTEQQSTVSTLEPSTQAAQSHDHSGKNACLACAQVTPQSAYPVVQKGNQRGWSKEALQYLTDVHPKLTKGAELITKAVPYTHFAQFTPNEHSRLLRYAQYASGASVQTLPHLCWSDGSSTILQQAFSEVRALALFQAAQNLGSPEAAQQASTRWFFTATDGFTGSDGKAVTLTWSIVPDGTLIVDNLVDENGNPTTRPSNLIEKLNEAYGASPDSNIQNAPWFSIFENAFAEWAAVTGNIYVYETADDGVDVPAELNAQGGVEDAHRGSLGTRADIRISGARIDGNASTLAFNYFPDFGDMVIDTDDSFNLTDTVTGRDRLLNVIAHEHGHGLGLAHVCPVNRTKLMEPSLSTRFVGVQFDDILTIQGLYGDSFEGSGNNSSNNTSNSAHSIGSISSETTISDASISVSGDVDFYSFRVNSPASVHIDLMPTLTSPYPEGPQNGATCVSTGDFNPRNRQNLELRVFDTNGSTVLNTSIGNAIGEGEFIQTLELSPGNDYFISVSGGGENSTSVNNAQIYSLALSQTPIIPVVSMDVIDNTAEEFDSNNTATFRVNANKTLGSNLSVAYTLSGSAQSGSDFTALTGSGIITANTDFTDIPVVAIRDSLTEGPEDLTLTISSSANYQIMDGSATITINDLPVDNWRFENFGSSNSNSGDLEDFDFDGIANLLEYALGFDPTSQSSPLVSSVSEDGTKLELSFQEDTTLEDISYTVECSSDLSADSWTTEGVTLSNGTLSNGKRQVTASITLSEERKFLRLNVSRQ
jgi:hypothetical protein